MPKLFILLLLGAVFTTDLKNQPANTTVKERELALEKYLKSQNLNKTQKKHIR
jgi:hypothetical protein